MEFQHNSEKVERCDVYCNRGIKVKALLSVEKVRVRVWRRPLSLWNKLCIGPLQVQILKATCGVIYRPDVVSFIDKQALLRAEDDETLLNYRVSVKLPLKSSDK